jgi:hypothetical protein
MTEADGADELVAGTARIGVTGAAMMAERAARGREADARARQADAEQQGRQLDSRAQATTEVDRAAAEPCRRAGDQVEAAALVTAADAADDRTRPIDPEIAEARRLAALHQAHPPIEAVRTAPALSGPGASARGGRARSQGQERDRGR